MYRLAVCEDEEQVRGALCALCSEILGDWGVTGIVTLNDLLEQLVGELDGESDEPGSGNELSGDGAQEDA